MMPPNWKQIEREEDEIDRELADGKITPKEYARLHRELQRDIADIYEEDRETALRGVDDEWGIS